MNTNKKLYRIHVNFIVNIHIYIYVCVYKKKKENVCTYQLLF